MDYFSNLADESNISAKYEDQLNLLNSQKNEKAEQLTTLKNQYADELYNYGLSAATEKLGDIKGVIESGIDIGGIGAVKGLAKLYKGSDIQGTVDEGIDAIKGAYSRLTAPGVKGADTAPEQEGMELEDLTGKIENEAVEAGSEFPSAGLTQVDTGTVGGVTEATEQAVDTENQEASAFNSQITSDVDRGELTADSPAEADAGAVTDDTAQEANSLIAEQASAGITDGTEAGTELASQALSKLLPESASTTLEGIGGLASTELAENSLDFSGLGEVLAVGSLVTTGIKAFVDWIDPQNDPPPPPVAPKFQPMAEAPTFISSQVQAGL